MPLVIAKDSLEALEKAYFYNFIIGLFIKIIQSPRLFLNKVFSKSRYCNLDQLTQTPCI